MAAGQSRPKAMVLSSLKCSVDASIQNHHLDFDSWSLSISQKHVPFLSILPMMVPRESHFAMGIDLHSSRRLEKRHSHQAATCASLFISRLWLDLQHEQKHTSDSNRTEGTQVGC